MLRPGFDHMGLTPKAPTDLEGFSVGGHVGHGFWSSWGSRGLATIPPISLSLVLYPPSIFLFFQKNLNFKRDLVREEERGRRGEAQDPQETTAPCTGPTGGPIGRSSPLIGRGREDHGPIALRVGLSRAEEGVLPLYPCSARRMLDQRG